MSYTPGPLPEPRGWITDGHADGIRFRETAPAGIEALVVSSAPVYTDHQLVAHTAAEVARAVAAERERLALSDDAIDQAYNEAWRSLPSDFGHTSGDWFEAGARYVASLADPQRLQGKGGVTDN